MKINLSKVITFWFVRRMHLSISKFINVFYCYNYTGLSLRKIRKLLGNMKTMDKSELVFHWIFKCLCHLLVCGFCQYYRPQIVKRRYNPFLAINLISHPSLIGTSKQGFFAQNQKNVVLRKCHQQLWKIWFSCSQKQVSGRDAHWNRKEWLLQLPGHCFQTCMQQTTGTESLLSLSHLPKAAAHYCGFP